ncbi:MAG TPA: hypothetical protein VG276_27950 [Actinomycetes bacterium]|nr:hypothetical protein [Actinomycetes bacterium]
MKRILLVLATLVGALTLAVPVAHAGEPHFIDSAFSVARSGDTLTVGGKEAGLGDEEQIVVTVSADAACLNPGENFPQAANKQTFSTTITVPVQNGKADYQVTLTFAVQPRCNPPMSLVIGNVTVFDSTNSLTFTFPGTF